MLNFIIKKSQTKYRKYTQTKYFKMQFMNLPSDNIYVSKNYDNKGLKYKEISSSFE